MSVITWRVTIETPKGTVEVDVPSTQGKEAAERRAKWVGIEQRWGDVDEVVVTSSVAVCGWFAKCDNESTGTIDHPALGAVPICDRCQKKVEELRGKTPRGTVH